MDNQLIRHKRKIHLSATQKIALSFAMMIFVGSILLSLPIANKTVPRTYIDNLFIATSCVCVTGLTPFTVVDQYNLFGQLVMMVLIQFGGLGFLSFLYLFLNCSSLSVLLLIFNCLAILVKSLINSSVGTYSTFLLVLSSI